MTRRSYRAILCNCEKEFAFFFSTRYYFFFPSGLLVFSFSKDINGSGNLYQVAKGKKFSIDLVSLMLLLELSDQLDYCSFRRLELFSDIPSSFRLVQPHLCWAVYDLLIPLVMVMKLVNLGPLFLYHHMDWLCLDDFRRFRLILLDIVVSKAVLN